MKSKTYTTAMLLAMLLAASSLSAQPIIGYSGLFTFDTRLIQVEGTISQAGVESPVAEAYISITGLINSYSAISNENGNYVITDVPPGNYNLSVTKDGFQSQNINVVITGEPPVQVINVSLTSLGSPFIQINSELKAYADNIVQEPHNVYTLTGNVSINNLLKFTGTIKVDMRQSLHLPEISGSCGMFANYYPDKTYVIKGDNIGFKYYADENRLIVTTANFLVDGAFQIGGFDITIGEYIFDKENDFVEIKAIPKMPYPIGSIIDFLREKYKDDIPLFVKQISASLILSKTQGLHVSMEVSGLSIYLGPVSLSDVSLKIRTIDQTFGGGFMLKIPGEKKPTEKRHATDSIDYCDVWRQLHFEIQDENKQLIDSLSFAELIEMQRAVDFKLGFEIEFTLGTFNKFILIFGGKIPLGKTGLFLTKVQGGVDDVASGEWKVKASVDIGFGKPFGPFGYPFELKDFGIVIQPFNIFRGEGRLTVFNWEQSKGFIEYKPHLSSLSAGSSINILEIIKGKSDFSLVGDRVTGSGLLTIQTPSTLPWFLWWLRNRQVGSAYAYFNNQYIQSQVNIWRLNFAMKMEFGSVEPPWFHLYLGSNLNSLHKIWKGEKDGKHGIIFQVPENSRQLLVVAMDTINPTQFDFVVQNPSGQIFDQENAYIYYVDEDNKQTIMSLLKPLPGDWYFLTDYEGEVALFASELDQEPVTLVSQPLERKTRSNNISLSLTDYSDTLQVQVYYSDNNRHFNGTMIQEFTVVNNGTLDFIWQNQHVPNGEYFIYVSIYDGYNTPVLQYAPGSIMVQNDPDIKSPKNFSVVQQDTVFVASWDGPVLENIIATSVYYRDISTGRINSETAFGENTLMINDLKPGQEYQLWACFINENHTFSEPSNKVNRIFTSSTRNNPPYFTLDPDSMFVFVEGSQSQYIITANDADGDLLTFDIPNDTLGIVLSGNQLIWTPTAEQIGVYDLMITVNDGADTDTTYQQLAVFTQHQVSVDLSFSSVNLYENDNMFVRIRNYFCKDYYQQVTLRNTRTQELVSVETRRVNDFEYIGQFSLSFINRSEISVANGDTIEAKYSYLNEHYYAYAYYDSLPQPSDITPPGIISDLTVERLENNRVKLIWTATGDDGDMGRAYRYDIRYAYETIESEEVYFTAYRLQNFPYPSLAGEQDSLEINLMDLQFIDQHDRVWFSIKAEDAAQNRSALGNSADVLALLQPANVTASVQDVYNIHLTWQGPQSGDKSSNAFESYTIFRQYNEGSYSQIAGNVNALSYTDDLKVLPDGVYRYGIQSVYENGESEITYSEPVSLHRFMNVNILCNLHGHQNHAGIQFKMTANDDIYGQEFIRTTNASGLIMLANVFKSDYTVEISKGGYVTHEEVISVTNSQFGFIFTLYCEPLTPADLSVEYITFSTAMIDWTVFSIESHWDILYGFIGFDPASEGILIKNITGKPYLLSGLSHDTAYDVYLRAVCGENVSEWSAPISFTTPKLNIPNDLPLSGVISDGETECIDAIQTIIVSGFTVEAGGSVTLIAGESIQLLPGTTVEYGGYLLARIAANHDDFCGSPRAMETAEEPVIGKEDVVSAGFPYEIRENGFFKIYPNPTDGTFTLELTTAEPWQSISVEIHSMLGNRLFSKELPAQRMHTLSLEGYQSGLYIIRVMKGDKVGVERLIKR